MSIAFIVGALILSAQSSPAGWQSHRPPGPGFSEDRTCASHSARSWAVEATDEGVHASLIRRHVTPEPVPFPIPFARVLPTPGSEFPLPPGTSVQSATANQAKLAENVGVRHVARLGEGWLVGFDVGEYGGSLWWSPAAGVPGTKLLHENVVTIVPLQGGKDALVFVGLSHMGSDTGRVHRVQLIDGEPKVSQLVDLGTEPQTARLEKEGSVLFLTGRQLQRIWPDGRLLGVCAVETYLLSPRSISVSPTGEVYVGMKHYLARITPGRLPAQCSVEWFVPKDCSTFVEKDFDCVCRR